MGKGSGRRTLRRLGFYMGRYTAPAVLEIVLAGMITAFTLGIPVLCGKIIDCMAGPGSVDFDRIAGYLVIMAVCVLGSGALQWAASLISNHISFSVSRDIRNDAMETVTRLPVAYTDSHRYGGIVSRVTSDVDRLTDGMILALDQLFQSIFTIAGTLALMISISPSIALTVVLLTPVSLLVAGFLAKRTHRLFGVQAESRAELSGYVNEMVTEQQTIRAFSGEEEALLNFGKLNGEYMKRSLKAIFFSSVTNPATRLVNNVIYALVCLAGCMSAIDGGLTVGALSSALAFAGKYAKPFNEISGIVTEIQNALVCAGRVFELTDEKRYPEDPEGAAELSDPEGRVGFDSVSFSYVPEERLIEDFSLDVKKGEHVAIVGPTGAGKTTIVNLLMRFYDPDSGSICLDGRSTRMIKRDSLTRSVGMVLQDTWIMHGTVRDNILMGRKASDGDVERAARLAHAHGFIMKMPRGYDTVISDDDGVLSQGQRQLICIARVFVAVPPVLILDEATSSIDTRTELKIQDAFGRLTEGRTSFVIAHRLSTIRDADRIIVMNSGRIVESGRHDELLEKGGFYRELWESRFR
ncbi:MAG: ABC transporter ATP-binding protein [Clostridia bacterium]|nr:ABC transporter ATP-binding protein [Clostridia bacterium]